MLALCWRGLFEKQVQRLHPPLDVDVLDDDHVAIFLDERWRVGFELRDELWREASARQRDVGVFERVGHATDAIVMLD